MQGVVFLGDRSSRYASFRPGAGTARCRARDQGVGHVRQRPARLSASLSPGDTTSGFTRGADPVIAGHEPCGAWSRSAPRERREARVGQRVMDHHYTGCETCKHCR